jgi:hypothetical protein
MEKLLLFLIFIFLATICFSNVKFKKIDYFGDYKCECIYDAISIHSGVKIFEEKYAGPSCYSGKNFTDYKNGFFADTPATLYYKLKLRKCIKQE